MPFYQYSVTNNQGQTVLGTLQATNADAARAALTSSGYTVQSVLELESTGVARPTKSRPTPAPAQPASPAARQTSRPSQTPGVRQSGLNQTAVQPQPVPLRKPELNSTPQINSIPAGPAKKDTYKTKNGRDRDLFFLFSQLGSYFRSGVNPVLALNDMARKTPPRYQDSLKHAGQVVSEGGRMSDVFEKYPYLYPPDVVGTVRAGETAGFLPEAMDEIASKLELSHRMKKRLKYFSYIFVATIAMAPMIYGMVQGSLHSIAVQDDANGSLPVVGTLGRSVGASLWHDLPVTLLLFGAMAGLITWLNSMPMRRFRHMMIIRMPVFGGRAMSESMARFTWAMGMVSRGGLSAQQTYLLGLQSVPNLFVRERLETEGHKMTESEKLSTALRRSELLPTELGHIVETGEVTGDVPKALENVAKATDADFQGRNATAITSSGFIFYGLLGILILVLAAWLLRAWYGGLITTLTRD